MGRDHAEGEPCCGACASAIDHERQVGAASREAERLVFALTEAGAPIGAELVVEGRAATTAHPVTRDRWVVGRGAQANSVVQDPKVARQQCAFEFSEAGVRVSDLGSSCGTFVDGKAIRSAHWLREGDRVLIADLVLELRRVR